MAGDVDAVQRQGGSQAAPHLVEDIEEDRLFDWPARRRGGDQHRHGRPGPGRIHAAVEAGDLGRQVAGRGARQRGDGGAAHQALPGEILQPGRRREGIGLEMQAEQRDARSRRPDDVVHAYLPDAALPAPAPRIDWDRETKGCWKRR